MDGGIGTCSVPWTSRMARPNGVWRREGSGEEGEVEGWDVRGEGWRFIEGMLQD